MLPSMSDARIVVVKRILRNDFPPVPVDATGVIARVGVN
jgi:hypothetical protein